MLRLASLTAAFACLAALLVAVPASAKTPASCGQNGYSYAGVMRLQGRFGVSTMLTPVAQPQVASGHVAAWVGVGGAGLGPNGSDEWLQAGLVAYAGSSVKLYYELKRPDAPAKVVLLNVPVRLNQPHRVGVLESREHPGFWRVWVDGRSVSQRLFLPHSHKAWLPVATAESWDGGTQVCNGFSFRFDQLRVASKVAGGWHAPTGSVAFEDPGYRIVRTAPSRFLAHST